MFPLSYRRSCRLIPHRNGFPKKTEIFFFFRIDDDRVKEFREQLTELVPLITTTNQVKEDRKKIDELKKRRAERKGDTPNLLKMCGVSLSFSHKGLEKVRRVPDMVVK